MECFCYSKHYLDRDNTLSFFFLIFIFRFVLDLVWPTGQKKYSNGDRHKDIQTYANADHTCIYIFYSYVKVCVCVCLALSVSCPLSTYETFGYRKRRNFVLQFSMQLTGNERGTGILLSENLWPLFYNSWNAKAVFGDYCWGGARDKTWWLSDFCIHLEHYLKRSWS